MDKRTEFSKWMSTVEQALSGDMPLEEDTPVGCECGQWNCTTCFPDKKERKLGDIVTKTEFRKTGGEDSPLTFGDDNLDEEPDGMEVQQPLFGDEDTTAIESSSDDQKDPYEMIAVIKDMQLNGTTNANKNYSEEELERASIDDLDRIYSEVSSGIQEMPNDLAEPPEGPKPTKTKLEPDFDMDDILSGGTNHPVELSKDSEEDVIDEPPMDLPTASSSQARDAMSRITPSQAMRNDMNKISYTAGDDELLDLVDPENALVVRTARDVPAAISSAMQMTGSVSPTWFRVRDLPGMTDRNIRAMGRDVFSMFTSTPAEEMRTIANVGGQGPNTDREMKAVASWLYNNADDLGESEIDFSHNIPGYDPQVKEYEAKGVRFQVVRDNHGVYIYAYPAADARDYRLGRPDDNEIPVVGNSNSLRLRESNKGTKMGISLFEELKLDEEIREAFNKVEIEESEMIEESTLSANIAWYPGSPGKQKRRQGGWNLLNLLHKKYKLSNEASMEPLPYDRNMLNGYFKANPDNFVIIQGKEGVAAVRPDPGYHEHRRKKQPNWNRDQTEINDPYMPYQIIAFKNDGKELDPSLFQTKEKENDGGAADDYQITDPTVKKTRFGIAHMRKEGPHDAFNLLDNEIGYCHGGIVWMSGFYALKANSPKYPDRETRATTGSVERSKLAHRAASPGVKSTPRIPGGYAKSDAEKAARFEPAGNPNWAKRYKAKSGDISSASEKPVYDPNTKTWRKGGVQEPGVYEAEFDEASKHDWAPGHAQALKAANQEKRKERSANDLATRKHRDTLKYSGPVPTASTANVLTPEESKKRIITRIRPMLKPIVDMAFSKVSMAFNDAASENNDVEAERLLPIKKAINQFRIAIDTQGEIQITGAVSTILDKAINSSVGVPSYDPKYKVLLSELANGPSREFIEIVKNIRKVLIGAIR